MKISVIISALLVFSLRDASCLVTPCLTGCDSGTPAPTQPAGTPTTSAEMLSLIADPAPSTIIFEPYDPMGHNSISLDPPRDLTPEEKKAQDDYEKWYMDMERRERELAEAYRRSAEEARKRAEEARKDVENDRKIEAEASREVDQDIKVGADSNLDAERAGRYMMKGIEDESRAEQAEKEAKSDTEVAAWHEQRAEEEKQKKAETQSAINQSDVHAAGAPAPEIF